MFAIKALLLVAAISGFSIFRGVYTLHDSEEDGDQKNLRINVNNHHIEEEVADKANTTTAATEGAWRRCNSRAIKIEPSPGFANWSIEIEVNHTSKRVRSAPVMSDAGVVIFYHSPKTGGTSLRKFVQDLPTQTQYARLNRFAYDSTSRNSTDDEAVKYRLIDDILQGRRQEVMFAEMHGDIPGLPDLKSWMEHCRQTSQRTGVPFFAVSLVREPIEYYVSYFAFFHALKCPDASFCERERYSLTTEHLRESAVPNRQCGTFLGHQTFSRMPSEDGKTTHSLDLPVDFDDPSQIWDLFVADWDWVGTTDTLDDTTIPLIRHVFGIPTPRKTVIGKFKQLCSAEREKLLPSNLDSATYNYLHNISACDRQVYDWVRDRYQLIELS